MGVRTLPTSVERLRQHGVVFPAPHTVDVGEEVMPERIAPGAVIHAGCRLRGIETSIGPGSILGREQPLTLINCQLGHRVALAGGSAEGATFLDGASVGSGAHIRAGTLLEEEANGAHTVGFKQTLLFPFVTTGSLVNFCDCMMAGGTSRRNHSEVGSSYVHFNFTPHGDKATASIMGDVPRGVMLDQPPVFLGGQGGLAGPVRLAFGSVVAAGSILREDILVEGHLHFSTAVSRETSRPYPLGRYRDIRRIIQNGLYYLANIRALQHWYRDVRGPLMRRDPYHEACHQGAVNLLEVVFRERVHRLGELAQKMPLSLDLLRREGESPESRVCAAQQEFHDSWPRLEVQLRNDIDPDFLGEMRDTLLTGLAGIAGSSYVDTIQTLDSESKAAGREWLQGIVDRVTSLGHSGPS